MLFAMHKHIKKKSFETNLFNQYFRNIARY